MASLDDLFNQVLDAYKAADPSQLPPPIRDAYTKARDEIDRATANLHILPDNVVAALGPSMVAMGESVLSGNAEAAEQALFAAAVAIATLSGSPILGTLVAGAEQGLLWLQSQYGAKADTNCKACTASGSRWIGAFDVSKGGAPPLNAQDTRWVKWTDSTPHGRNGDTVCSDDCPTAKRGDFPDVAHWCGGADDEVPLSGSYWWLPAVIAANAADTADGALARQLADSIERYMNARGPKPDSPHGFALLDFAQNFLLGWNAIHQGPAVDIVRSRLPTKTTTSTFAGKTTTSTDPDWVAAGIPLDITDRVRPAMPGALFLRFGVDSSTNTSLRLNTGPLLPSIQAMLARQGHVVKLRGPRLVRQGARVTKAATTLGEIGAPVGGGLAGGAVGFFVGGPVGAVIGAAVGAAGGAAATMLAKPAATKPPAKRIKYQRTYTPDRFSYVPGKGFTDTSKKGAGS